MRTVERLLIGAPLIAALLLFPCAVHGQSDATAPSNLTATLGDVGIVLDWDAPTEGATSVTGYEILRRRPRHGEMTLLIFVADTESVATTYTDQTVTQPGERYVYRVKALRGVEKSGQSNFARVDIPTSGSTPTPEPTRRPSPRACLAPRPTTL